MKKLLSITAAVLSAFTVSAQCPQISCPSNITVNNAPGTCGAVVNYTTPIGTNPCGLDSVILNYTGSVQTYTIPQGVTKVTIKTWGAKGGGATPCSGPNEDDGGLGGYAFGELSVTPGQTLNIYVGGFPGLNTNNTLQLGGFNGGGSGGTYAAAGGGASDVRVGGTTLNDRVIVAGGGGGGNAGCPNHGEGGSGGGLSGGNGTPGLNSWTPGGGGTQVAGGTAGSSPGTAGSLGVGGFTNGGDYHIAGGGGGYYGGGGAYAAGGGGGSSYIGGVQNGGTTSGIQNGNGLVRIIWSTPATTTQISGLASGATFPVGTTTNWYKVEDGLGNKDSCSFDVTVVDNELPSISCPSDTTICWGIYNASVSTTDNCPGETIAQIAGPTLGSSFDVGTYNLIFVVTDASGNKDTCDYNVTVEICGGVNENNTKYGISVYPNPMKEFVIIENKNIEGSYTIEITNTLGSIVKTITTTEKRVEIQKGEMSKGMYYYNIKQNNQTLSSGKLAVE